MDMSLIVGAPTWPLNSRWTRKTGAPTIMKMDEITPQDQSKHRLPRFWARYRAKHDKQALEVFSNPDRAKDVHAAERARDLNGANNASEAGRGISRF
jgi:hypothetical protein